MPHLKKGCNEGRAWVAGHYDGRAAAWGRDIRAADYLLPWTFRKRQDAVMSLLGPIREKKILDLGCGPGLLSAPLHRENFLVGLDVSFKMLELAGTTLCPIQGEGENLPFQDSSFDAVLAIENLQHLEEPLFFLKEMVRVTRAGGRLIISTLHQASLYHRTLACLGKSKHHYFHSWRQTAQTLQRLEVGRIEICYLGWGRMRKVEGWEPLKSLGSIGWILRGVKG